MPGPPDARCRAIVENSADAAAMLAADGRILLVSGPIERLTGYSPDQLLGTSAFDLVHPDDRRDVRDAFQRVLESREPIRIEYRGRHKDGTCRPRDVIGINRLADAAVAAVVVNYRDTTVGSLVEAALFERERRAAEQLRAVLSIVRIVLWAIDRDGQVTLSEGGPLHQLGLEPGQVVGRSIFDLYRDLPAVLDLSRAAMRGDSLQLEQKLGQTQKMEAIERLAGGIAHDRDAMPRGGVLSIETAKVELDRAYVDDHPGSTAGPHVMPAISDTGVGMDPAVQEHLFEPFYTTKEPGKGTGLGLATVYGIVNQSGGSILVHSEADRGTSVKVFLPRVAPAAEISAGPVEIPAGLRGGETILLVEDQQEVRAVVQHMLGRHGYIDLAASHGNDALAAAREHQGDIDLLIADVVMPGMNGRDLVGQFLRELPDAQVLYMSGYTDDGVVLQGIVEQTVAFIQKPFTPATLLQKVREILDAENPGGASS